jgi:hypothetical protein
MKQTLHEAEKGHNSQEEWQEHILHHAWFELQNPQGNTERNSHPGRQPSLVAGLHRKLLQVINSTPLDGGNQTSGPTTGS